MTDGLQDFFYAEISNERQGGVSPSTLESAVDSLSQAPEVFHLGQQDLVALSVILVHTDEKTELRDLL